MHFGDRCWICGARLVPAYETRPGPMASAPPCSICCRRLRAAMDSGAPLSIAAARAAARTVSRRAGILAVDLRGDELWMASYRAALACMAGRASHLEW